jgi:hypothetical protein
MTVLESFFSYARMQTQVVSPRANEPAREFAFAREGRAGEVYNEEAFRHFLAIERARAERSQRPLLLLLVGLHRCPQVGFEVSPEQSSALFSGLGECLRDVDFLGWYRERRMLGAVLTQGLGTPCEDETHSRIAKRVQDVLRSHLSDHLAERLRVRVVQLGANVNA